MEISKDLMLAVLSLDAYNRGYGEGIKHDQNSIGIATFLKDDISTRSQAAGFYAAAYDTPYGVVISARARGLRKGTGGPSLIVLHHRGGWGNRDRLHPARAHGR